MDRDTLLANRQKALIQDSVRSAFKDIKAGNVPAMHPFVLAVQTLKREIEFMQPFSIDETKEMFTQVSPVYQSSIALISKAEPLIFGDHQVAPEADQLLPLVEYHCNLLKIHRLLLTRAVEGYSLIPSAPEGLQHQVVRTYEALGNLDKVLTSISQIPKLPKGKSSSARSKASVAKPVAEVFSPLDIEERVSPFITEGPKKSTVSIDGCVWPRYV